MGPELVWKAVLEWPVIVLCTAIAIHWLLRWKRTSSAAGVPSSDRTSAPRPPSRASRFVPIVAVLLPVMVSIAVQEQIDGAPAPTKYAQGIMEQTARELQFNLVDVGTASGQESKMAARDAILGECRPTQHQFVLVFFKVGEVFFLFGCANRCGVIAVFLVNEIKHGMRPF